MTEEHLRELFEERAAIMQFDGKMSKADAERAAEKEQLQQIQQGEL